MKSVYEAANTVDAQLFSNWLLQSGIHSRIEGNYLQGGVGELQAIGIVRVLVDDSDWYAAKRAVVEWDSLHSDGLEQSSSQRAARVNALGRRLLTRMFWVVVAVAVVLLVGARLA